MIFPIGRDTLLSRFPWATALLFVLHVAVFFGTWPAEKKFLSVRWPNSPLVTEGKALASLALDDGSTLPGDVRIRLEDLRAQSDFPDAEADDILQAIQKNFDYLPTLRRPDWDLRYAGYLQVRKEIMAEGMPWRSTLERFVCRSDDPLWPRLATHVWVHAGYLHLLLILFFLWYAGSFMEEVWGFFTTLLIYLAGAAAAALAVRYALPGSDWLLLGGSGAVSALMGAMAVRHAGDAVRFVYVLGPSYGVFSLPAWTGLLVWAGALSRIGWLTDGRLDGPAAHWMHGAGFLSGVVLGGVAALVGRPRSADLSAGDSMGLHLRAEAAARLMADGKTEEARATYQSVLAADGNHIPSLRGLLAAQELLHQDEEAAHTAVKIVRTALEDGKGKVAEEVFRKWSMRLFQAKLSTQERMVLAQNLETLQLWREALAYYRGVYEQDKGSPFAGKALFASAKIHKDQFKKPEDAAQLFRQLLDPPYDLEWAALAQGELRIMGKA